MSYLTRYFQSVGAIDAIRGRTMEHIATLDKAAQDAYQRGQASVKPRTYTYKLTRTVGELKSGTLVTRLGKVSQDAKGKVSVMHNGVTLELPVSRLTAV